MEIEPGRWAFVDVHQSCRRAGEPLLWGLGDSFIAPLLRRNQNHIIIFAKRLELRGIRP